ncbi:hypothetical protein RZN05_08325 [Sphingomonas sp. HF-S4]|uniref:Uncharacterized protein n=1 Tax=Sphingomonas agrestis TaxID=3080540 RepID=A0ABU3Y6G4_9SPHN|nr:hypothetical protein [Sphingomonas sp. HF-S4]MDV3456985.1 hypothetical protein [Sphingomonas sp. HF-S4]
MLSISQWWVGLAVELQAALIGAGATAGAAIFGVLAVIAQVRSQGRQSRAAIAETERRKINAALYEDAVLICRGLADASIGLSTKLHIMNMEIEVAARAEAAALAYNLPTARFPMLSALYGEFTDSALRFIFLIENRRVVDPRILIFRTAMSTVLHDSRKLMFSDFVLHVMPALPTDSPDGGIFPYKPPSVEGARAIRAYSDQLIQAVDDTTAYTEDFLTEMQNVLLGDLYGNHLEPRQPLDPARKAVTLDRAQELEAWFTTNTAWGVEAARVEAETRQRFLPRQ